MEARQAVAPEITDEQRAEALRKAARVRHERAEMLRRVKAGEVDPRGVLMRRDDVARRTRVLRFIESWPGYGRAKAERLMGRLGIAGSRRLGGLGRRQREALAEAMPEFEGGE